MADDPLSTWLRNAHQILCVELTGETPVSNHTVEDDESMILTVATGVFGCDFSFMEDVKMEVERRFNVKLGTLADFSSLIEYLLIHAVSAECAYRAVLVGGIMEMEATIQAALMHIIQSTQQTSDDTEDVIETEVPETEEVDDNYEVIEPDQRENSAFETAAPSSAVNTSSSIRPFTEVSYSSASCGNCTYHEGVAKRLTAELASLQERTRQEVADLQKQLDDEKSKFVDAELMIVQRDDRIHQVNNSVLDLQKQLSKADAIIERNKQLEEEIVLLQDQIDVMKPQAENLAQAEALVEKLRSRLEEMSSIKQQLQQESMKHNATHTQLLELEKEVTALRKLKPQLDEYRDQHAESIITVGELQARLKEKEEAVASMTREIEALRGSSGHHLAQSQELAEQLHAAAERLRETERTGGIGDGISELNPELMHQLDKLRTENEHLKDQLDQTSVEALELKDKRIADQDCVNNSLQKKLMNTKDALEEAIKKIAELNMTVDNLNAQLAQLKDLFDENTAMQSEELVSIKNMHNKQLSSIRKQHDRNMAEMHVEHTTHVQKLTDKLVTTERQLQDTEEQLGEMTELQSITACRLSDTQSSLLEVTQKRKREQVDHEEAIAKLNTDFEQQLEEVQNKTAEEKLEMKKAHAAAIAAEQQRINELHAELEEESIKRRKIERQKKFHELESQRQKSQLQAAGANGLAGSRAVSEELEYAVKEMKQMQQQLDAAKAEIVMLRSAGGEGTPSRSKASSLLNLVASPRHKVSAHPLSASKQHSSATGAAGNSIRAPALRAGGAGAGAESVATGGGCVAIGSAAAGGSGVDGSSYFEQVEFAERRIEQLVREKREMLSKNLEETKEKNELSQKLLLVERENSSLKADIRKLTLEKERAERKLRKQTEGSISQYAANANKENIVNE